MKKGDKVVMEVDGEKYDAYIVIASENEVSLIVGFEAIVAGHVGMMPLFKDEDGYHSIIDGTRVTICTCV